MTNYLVCTFYCANAQCYAIAVYAVVVCLCVCLSHPVLKLLNLGSCKQCHMIDQGLESSVDTDLKI